MLQWLPLISHLYPGINPLTVNDLSYKWWLVYVEHAKAYVEENERAEREARKR